MFDDEFCGYDVNDDEWNARLGTVEDAIWRRMFASPATGKYVMALEDGADTITSATHSTGVATFVPFRIRRPVVIAKICQRVVAAGGNIDMALYASNNATGRPTGTPIRTTGSAAANVANSSVEPAFASGGNLTIDYSYGVGTYQPGIFWMGVQSDSALLTLRAYKSSVPILAMMFGASSLAQAAGDSSTRAVTGLTCARTFGTWGDVTGETWTELAGANVAKNFVPQYKVA